MHYTFFFSITYEIPTVVVWNIPVCTGYMENWKIGFCYFLLQKNEVLYYSLIFLKLSGQLCVCFQSFFESIKMLFSIKSMQHSVFNWFIMINYWMVKILYILKKYLLVYHILIAYVSLFFKLSQFYILRV